MGKGKNVEKVYTTKSSSQRSFKEAEKEGKSGKFYFNSVIEFRFTTLEDVSPPHLVYPIVPFQWKKSSSSSIRRMQQGKVGISVP